MIVKKTVTETKTKTIKPARYDKNGVLLDVERQDFEFERVIYAVQDGEEEHHFASEEDAKRFIEGRDGWQHRFK